MSHTMSLLDFLSDLQNRQVYLWLEGDQLRYRSAKGALTPELRAQIVERKQEIVLLLQEMQGATKPTLPPITSSDRRQPIPLSFSQERLWILERLQEGSSAYVIHAALKLDGDLDRDALEAAFQEVIRRHEILRTTFPIEAGQPVQHIAPFTEIPIIYADLTQIPIDEQEAHIEAARLAQKKPFDLAHGPLLRITLLRQASQTHVLLLTLHHIIADGWSVGIIMSELSAMYGALRRGDATELPSLPVQYADVAQWQRDAVQNHAFEHQRSYWKTKLDNLGDVELIRPDHARMAVRTFRGQRATCQLSRELSQALHALAQKQDATVFMLLLATLAILLRRRSNQQDITIGSPVAGRTQPELERLIGCFVNTLVFRVAPTDKLTFEELLQQVRHTALEAYENVDIPFEQLLNDLQVERDASRTPLFQVFLNMLPFEVHPQTVAGLTMTLLTPPYEDAKFDLTMYIEEQSPLLITLVYNADLFEPDQIEELLKQYQLLLQQISEAPQAAISSFSLVTETAYPQLPDPAQLLPPQWTEPVHVQFARQAQQTPSRLAISGGGHNWTYQELELRSNQLAQALIASGVQPQQRVAIYAYRTTALPWALLGVFKAGAVCCLLDSAEPTTRLVACLRQVQPNAWLNLGSAPLTDELQNWLNSTTLAYQASLPATADAAGDLVGAYPDTAPENNLGPEDWAYIAFTSGSTGQPKGVIGTHRPLAHFVLWQRQTFDVTEADRFTMLSGLAHDPLLRDILTPLISGASVHVPDEQHMDGPNLLPWLIAEGITIMHLTPSMAKYFFPDTPTQAEGTSALRYIFFGGEPLHWQDIARIRAHAGTATCVNFYGLTETPQAMAYHRLQPDMHDVGTVPLGHGIDGVQLLVLNPARRLAGIGEVGELAIRTPYLALGYLDDEVLTQQRFITNPYTQVATDHMHCTGDYGYYRLDGTVQYVGRADRQIKLRGFRVEPGEIEHHLRSHPAVREAHVMVSHSSAGSQSLIGYVVLQEPSISDNELRQHLRRYVPIHMIPSALIRLERLPTTATGKVDMRALPDYLGQRAQGARLYQPPTTVAEQRIASIWSEVLGVQQVGRHDNFFELGGHSLSATLILHRLEEQFGTQIPLRKLFEDPTVSGIARLVEQQEVSDEVSQAIRPVARGTQQISDLLAELNLITATRPNESEAE